MIRSVFVVILLVIMWPGAAHAQASHAEQLSVAAQQCLADVVAPYSSLRLDDNGSYPFLRSSLIEHWLGAGKTVYESASPDHPLIDYRVDSASVEYRKLSARQLERSTSLALSYGVTDTEGKILSQSTCRRTVTDEVSRSEALALVDDRYDFGRPEIPGGSRLRRFLEPAVVIAASAVGTYLFFNLRSRRADQ